MKNSSTTFFDLRKVRIAVSVLMLLPLLSLAQTSEVDKKKSQTVFRYNQYVMVTLKDGSEVPARVTSVKSKSKCYVRMIGGKKTGEVNKKYLRPMTPAEIEELKKPTTVSKEN